ncbi:MAG: hypothetical protein IR160_03685 [Salinibacterium sp.]|nr:hypothetical protein [Salinibacterium sp.]MBF0671669.1 hypothetical protein [Salinibacterium sp.]
MRSTFSDREATRPQVRYWRALAVALLLGTLVSGAPSASAAPDETFAPDAVQEEAGPLTITAPAEGAFIDRNSLTVRGTGTAAGATISVTVDGTEACTATVTETDDELTWACSIGTLTNGANRVVTVTQADGGDVTSASVTVHVLGPPTIDDMRLTTGVISGSAHPGATVQVTLSRGAGSCTTTATSTRYWSCTPGTPGGRVAAAVYDVSARQSHASIGPEGSRSSPTTRTIEIDNIAPQPPVITSPTGDYRLLRLPATFTGTGEEGGSVDVYLDGVPVCSARVAAGAWSCVGGSALSNAAHEVRAIQIDEAGNHSPPSAAIRVFFGPRPAAPTPEQPGTPSPSPTPSETPQEVPPPSTPSPSAVAPLPPLAGDAAPDAFSNWGTPTTFGDGLPSLRESVERGNWWRAPLIALGGIALIALPSRLLASELRGRVRERRPVAVRNREPVPLIGQHTTGMTPWLSAALPFAVTVAFMVVSNGVDAEVRYLRLAAAVSVALGLLNLVGVAIATRLGRLWQGVDGRIRFRPMLLAAAIATGLFSRLIGIVPPFVSGTLIGVRMPHETPVRSRAIVHLLQVGTVLGLGLVGWVGHSAVGDVVGFWPSLLSEILAALCLVGVGSTIVLLLPVGALPGRVLWEWHRWAWFCIALAGCTIAFAPLLGGPDSHWPLATLLIIAASIAALFIGAWATLRFLVRQPD